MDKPPMEWIDKLFTCMEEFYGERWTKSYGREPFKSMGKTMWQSGLTGCSHDQIRSVLVYLKRAAQDPRAIPPHQMEFHHFAKGYKTPHIDYSKTEDGRDYQTADPEVARAAIRKIKEQLAAKNCSP